MNGAGVGAGVGPDVGTAVGAGTGTGVGVDVGSPVGAELKGPLDGNGVGGFVGQIPQARKRTASSNWLAALSDSKHCAVASMTANSSRKPFPLQPALVDKPTANVCAPTDDSCSACGRQPVPPGSQSAVD